MADQSLSSFLAANRGQQRPVNVRGAIEETNVRQENQGILPYLKNFGSSVNRGILQAVETPYNIMNNAPRLVNLLPGEQGAKKISEMAANPDNPVAGAIHAMFPSEDPLIDLFAKYVPGADGVGGVKTPNPNYPVSSNVAEMFGSGMSGAGATPLLAKTGGIAGKFFETIAKPVIESPLKTTAAELASAAGGETGRVIAENNNLGPIGSFMAQFLGSMGPGALTFSAPNIAGKFFAREGGADALAAMERQGVRPSIGLTGNRTAGQVEAGASALPFFSSVPENVRTQQFDQFGNALEGAATKMRPAGSGPRLGTEMAEQTMDIVDQGAKRMKAGFSQREEALMKAIGPQTPVDTKNVRAAIAAQMQSGDAKIKRALQKELDDLNSIADPTTGAVPYENLRKWRSNFGSNMEDQGVLTGSKKQVYAGVSQDTEAVAKAAGQDKEFQSLMSDQAKAYDDTVSLADGGDLVQAKKTIAGGQSEASGRLLREAYRNPDRMAYIQRNATPEQWNQLRADIVSDLGLTRAGKQDATGDVVSPEKFLTEWNKMDPRVKNMLFDDDLGTRQTLDDLALIADAFKKRGGETNSSRTAGTGLTAMQIREAGKLPAGIAAGAAGYANLPATLAGAGLTYATVKALMSKTLARWAAGQTPTLQNTVAPRVPGALLHATGNEGEQRHDPLHITVHPGGYQMPDGSVQKINQ